MPINAPRVFVGRADILDTLNKRVESLKSGYRQNVALTGQKLCGKTYILQNFLSNLKSGSVIPVYIEVLTEPFEAFSKKFIGTILLNFLKGRNEEIKEDLDFLISKAEAFIPKTTASIKEILRLLEKGDHQEVYSGLFNLTSYIKEETGKSCIIIFDEFHNLSFFNLKNPFAVFGKKIMVQKDTMYVVTSSQVSSIKRILKERLDLLFGNFEIIEVRDFDCAVSKNFLERRLEAIRMQEELKDFLVSFTDGRPFYLDIISSELNNCSAQLQFKWAGPGVISEAFNNLLFDSKGAINQYFQNLVGAFPQSTLNDYLDILSAVAEGNNKLGGIRQNFRGKKADLPARIEKLIEENFLAKNGCVFYFNDKVFEFWLRYVYNKKRYSLLSDFQERAAMFKKDVEAMVAFFLAENKKDTGARIKELVSSFNNEIIKLGEKNLKFPRFSRIEIKNSENEGEILIEAVYDTKKQWAWQFSPQPVDEAVMTKVIDRFKAIEPAPQRKILILSSAIDTNATLIAKENKVWVWGKEDLNFIFSLYNKFKMLK
ncbi:MAG: ATP-binding protein [Candidatus Omnitrophica bacterium]|nr:ATP-binding protein [Candidatus Omnitrophota bacterium]